MIKSDNGEITVKGTRTLILEELEELILSLRDDIPGEKILDVISRSFKRKPGEYKIQTFNKKEGVNNIIKQMEELELPKDLQKRILKEMF